MPTYARIIIVIILFLLLLTYEFFHVRGKIKEYSKDSSCLTKNYIIMASVSYSILNIIVILLFLFLFPNHIFLSYRKLICLGGGILTFILANHCVSLYNYLNFLVLIEFFDIATLNIFCLSLYYTVDNYITTKENTTTIISNVTDVTKLYDINKNILYLVSYNEKNEEKKLALYENETEFSISDKSYINKTTTTYINIDPELKDDKENSRELKNVEIYSVYISKDLVTDYTD